MPQTIFFDFGNVVGFFDHDRAVRRLLAHTDLTAAELYARFYAGDLETRYECGAITTDEFFAEVKPLGRLTCSQEEFVDAFGDIFWPNPPVADLIPRLKLAGHKLYLASNTNDAHCVRFRGLFAATLAHFDGLVVSHEAKARKPTPAFFEYARRQAGAAPADCLLIDDLEVNVAGARAAGWDAILYQRFDDLMAELGKRGLM